MITRRSLLFLAAAPALIVPCRALSWQIPKRSVNRRYFELTLTHSFISGFDAGIAGFGICGATASLTAAGFWDNNSLQAAEAEICGSTHNSVGSGSAVGYPSKWVGINTGALDRVYALAVNLTAELIWFRDVTGASGWSSTGTAPPTPDPETDANGFDYSAVITGAVYAFGGATHNNFLGNYGEGVLNFGATAFVGAIPAGYVAWGAGETLNPSDKSGDILLSGSNLTFSSDGAGDLDNLGQIARSVGAYA